MTFENRPRIYVDFERTDGKRRVLLTAPGTRADLERHGIELSDGLPMLLYSDDTDEAGRPDPLLAEGRARFSTELGVWVAEINWSAIRNESELKRNASG